MKPPAKIRAAAAIAAAARHSRGRAAGAMGDRQTGAKPRDGRLREQRIERGAERRADLLKPLEPFP